MKSIKYTAIIALAALFNIYNTHTMLAPLEQQRIQWLMQVRRALWEACVGFPQKLNTLLQNANTPDWINSENAEQNSPLIQLIIDLQSNPPSPNAPLEPYEPGQWEPNTGACIQAIQLLINAGANPEQKNRKGQTALLLTEKLGSVRITNAIKRARTQQLINNVGDQAALLLQFKNALKSDEYYTDGD